MAKKKEIIDYEINFEKITDNYNLLDYLVIELLLDKCYKENIPEIMISNNNSNWNGFYISKQHNKKHIINIYNCLFNDRFLTNGWYRKGIYKLRINWGLSKSTKNIICDRYFKTKLLTEETVNKYLKSYNNHFFYSPDNLQLYLNNNLLKTFSYYNFLNKFEDALNLINDNDNFYIIMELSKYYPNRSNYCDNIYNFLYKIRELYNLNYITNNNYLKSEGIKEFHDLCDTSCITIGQQLYLSKNTLTKFGNILYEDNYLAKTIFDKLKQKQNGAEVL